MQILVFSDTHLYLPFDQKKFNFLKKIISNSDQVIINGDFFDSYMNSFEEFIKSPWNKLFSLLKTKKTVYIYGNHDQKKSTDNQVNLFSEIQTERYKINLNNKIYIFEHGHKTRPTPDMLFKMNWKFKHYGIILVHFVRNLLIKIFGKFIIQLTFGRLNKGSKKIIKKLYKPKNNEFYVIGHNHFGEIDEKNHFAVSGMILYGFAQYLTIDYKTAKITLHEEWYK
ncbi:MAG: metallophosphoesterase [Patescibacteria group bacterium]|jgi:predicted phosphodiesterase